MTHVSRPFQIILAAFVLLVAVWFAVLRDHTSAGTSGGSNASSSSPQPTRSSASASTTASTATRPHAHTSASASASTTATTVHRSTGSGHTTVTRTTVEHARTAARATVTRTTVSHHGRAAGTVVHTTTTHTTTVGRSSAKPAAAKPSTAKSAPAKPGSTAVGPPAAQVAVEHELRQGKTVLILFWNPKGYDDAAVRRELPAVQRSLHGAVAVRYASAGQVGEYGTITHAVQITQTPTLLIVNHRGQTTTITGLTDAFAIEQAISEARSTVK
jgi:hypothetical protein